MKFINHEQKNNRILTLSISILLKTIQNYNDRFKKLNIYILPPRRVSVGYLLCMTPDMVSLPMGKPNNLFIASKIIYFILICMTFLSKYAQLNYRPHLRLKTIELWGFPPPMCNRNSVLLIPK